MGLHHPTNQMLNQFYEGQLGKANQEPKKHYLKSRQSLICAAWKVFKLPAILVLRRYLKIDASKAIRILRIDA